MRGIYSKSRWLAVVSLGVGLAVAGCGNTPTSVLNSLNSTVTGLKAGIYDGTVPCTLTQLVGDSVTEGRTTSQRRVTVDESGMPLVDGQPLAVGATWELAFGEVSAAGRVTNVTVSNNGVVVTSDVYFTLPGTCLDTCQYAYDGECDDGGPGAVYNECLYGTDCSDCGQIPLEVAGELTRTYKDGTGDRIDLTESVIAAFSSEFVSGTWFWECSGDLAP